MPTAIFFTTLAQGQSAAAFTTSLRLRMPVDSLSVSSQAPLPSFKLRPNLYTTNLAFMCRQEWKIERSLRVPLRIRMGSLEQCNFLEGK